MDTSSIDNDIATEKLAAEMTDVQAAIRLVEIGAASGVTLTGLRFGRVIAERSTELAALVGVALETEFWTDDVVASDIHIYLSSPGTDQSDHAHA